MQLLRLALALYLPAVPAWWKAPADWYRGAMCIHAHEAAWNANTGNGFYGGLQFMPATWASVRGPKRPDQVSPREQLYRAWLVWLRDGRSWKEWPTRAYCGLL